MGRSARPWWLALALSLLLHGGLLGGLDWHLPVWQAPPDGPPLEVRLRPPAPPASRPPPAPPPRPQPVVAPAPLPAAPPPVVAPAPADVMPEPAPRLAAPEPVPVDAVAEPELEPELAAASAVEPPPEAVPPPLNALPPRLDLRYQVRYGLASGEQTLLWVNEGDHYTLTSVAAATGLASVFYSGRFVQTSRGRITARGLQPEEFWDQRGDKRSSARFDAAHDTLTLTPARGAPRHFSYQGEVQDALSLFFQLALTAPPAGPLNLAVFNGKKLRHYRYEVRGEERLDTALGPLNTLHLARVTDQDGRFEAWLAIDRHYLPVRVVRSDEKGNEMELLLQSLAP